MQIQHQESKQRVCLQDYTPRRSNGAMPIATSPFPDIPHYLKAPAYNVRAGFNHIRILPPTWEGAEYYGFPVAIHYNAGHYKHHFACLAFHVGEKCPMCILDSKSKPAKRVAYYVIDRNDHNVIQPKVWLAPPMFDNMLTSCTRKPDGSFIPIDHPEEGFDITFQFRDKLYVDVDVDKQPTGIAPAHVGADVMDAWLNAIVDTPLPEVVRIHTFNELAVDLLGGDMTTVNS